MFDGGLAREQINEAHAEVEVAVQQRDEVRRDIVQSVPVKISIEQPSDSPRLRQSLPVDATIAISKE